MAKKVVNVDELQTWLLENQYDAVPVGGLPIDFFLSWPAPEPKVVTQWYGINPQWYPGQPGHEGIDMRAINGAAVTAAAPGEVYRVEEDPESGAYGMHVRLKHDTSQGEFKTIYAHLQAIRVDMGDQVDRGKIVGLADNTGNSSGAHLHLTLKKVGEGSDWLGMGDIVNPVPYFPDLFPACTITGHTGQGWVVDVGGNFRTSPEVGNNLIGFIPPNNMLRANGPFEGDWWECNWNGRDGWFWNPGYKLKAL